MILHNKELNLFKKYYLYSICNFKFLILHIEPLYRQENSEQKAI